jgi:hypothetical protein
MMEGKEQQADVGARSKQLNPVEVAERCEERGSGLAFQYFVG